nr:T9SS type A sorting domain-containing protein [Bacteroidota bacterium]
TLRWDYVMIAITDSLYLQKGFQFRFKNYATHSGNVDHWHIDYVYLNRGRTKADTALSEMSFVYQPTSLLKSYQAMPWKQYKQSELRDSVNDNFSLQNVIRNHFNGGNKTINYDYSIRDGATVLDAYGTSGVALRPFDSTQLYTDCDIPAGCVDFVGIDTSVFPATVSGPREFSITHYFTTVDSVTQNDTVAFNLHLQNYFAYDDGTAETAFGLSTLDGLLAEKFVLNVADTLNYIDIYFNPIITNANLYSFDLKVWADGGGVPGTILYTSDTAQNPSYTQEGVNDFKRYELHIPLFLGAGTFYIGFEQNTNQFLNIGVDKNNNSQNSIYYNVTGTWNNSPIPGSLMMRPVFGFESITGLENVNASPVEFTIYPNPAKEQLMIRMNSENSTFRYEVIDLYGRILKVNNEAETIIDISQLSEGVYFLRMTDGKTFSTRKFIKVK